MQLRPIYSMRAPLPHRSLCLTPKPRNPHEPTPGVFSELRDNLHVSGYIQSNYGLFYNTEGTKWWPHHHLNSIESLRQLGQIDLNESFGEHLQFFARFWGVYEPGYPFENDAKMGDRNLNDFYNEYNFRDLWLKVKEGPLNIFIGKQIVEWGESLAFRVGDQINPQDVSYAFGFNNLEASHLPIYMLHPILNLPAFSAFSSNFFEMVYAPGFDDLWNHVDYPDDRFNGQDAVAGRVDVLPIPADVQSRGWHRQSMQARRVTLHSTRDRVATAVQLRAGSWQYSGRSMGHSASYVCQLSDRSQTAYPYKGWYRGHRILLAELRLYT